MNSSAEPPESNEDERVGLPTFISEEHQIGVGTTVSGQNNTPLVCPRIDTPEMVHAQASMKKVEMQVWLAKFLAGLVSAAFVFVVSIMTYSVVYADDTNAIKAILIELEYIKDIVASIVKVLI